MDNSENLAPENERRRPYKVLPPSSRQAVLALFKSEELSHLSISDRTEYLAIKFECSTKTIQRIVK